MHGAQTDAGIPDGMLRAVSEYILEVRPLEAAADCWSATPGWVMGLPCETQGKGSFRINPRVPAYRVTKHPPTSFQCSQIRIRDLVIVLTGLYPLK